MNKCKSLLKRYNKLQKNNKYLLLEYNTFIYKTVCRQDRIIEKNTSEIIEIKINESKNYYNKLKYNIKEYIDIIKRKNINLKNAINSSYNII